MKIKKNPLVTCLFVLALLTLCIDLTAVKKDGKNGDDKDEKTKTVSTDNPPDSVIPFDLFRVMPNADRLDSLFRLNLQDFKFNLLLISDDVKYRIPVPGNLESYKPGKRWGRAIVEGLGHFVYATSSYWIRQDVMMEDWEYQFNWKDQKRRFFFLDGPRFDSNTFQFNWTHSMAGAIYYNYARVNNFNSLESFLYTVGASYVWEFLVEFKEVVSVNDLISTPVGGVSIGESLFHMNRVFRDLPSTPLNKFARFVTNPVMALNYWLDRKKSLPAIHMGAANLWHDFRLYWGARTNRFSGDKTDLKIDLGIETQVMTLPEYGKTGAVSYYSKGTVASEFNADISMDSKGVYQFDIFAKAVLFGYFNQDIRESITHDKSGYSFFLGASTAFDLVRKRTPTPVEDPEEAYLTDKYCVINVVGPSFDLSLFRNDLKVRFAADVFADFAMIHSLAYFPYTDLHEVENTKSTLLNHGYYYALGYTVSSLFQVNYSNLELKGKFKYHYFDSVESLDRFQKEMADEDDFDLRDRRVEYFLSLGYQIPRSSIQLVLALEKIDREGWLEDFYRNHSETRSYFQVKYLF